MRGEPVVFVPGDIDVPDRLAGPVTLPMAGWLALAGAGAALAVLRWPAPLPVVAGGSLLALGVAAAFCRPDGRSLLTWLRLALGYRRRRSAAGETVEAAQLAEPGDSPPPGDAPAPAASEAVTAKPVTATPVTAKPVTAKPVTPKAVAAERVAAEPGEAPVAVRTRVRAPLAGRALALTVAVALAASLAVGARLLAGQPSRSAPPSPAAPFAPVAPVVPFPAPIPPDPWAGSLPAPGGDLGFWLVLLGPGADCGC